MKLMKFTMLNTATMKRRGKRLLRKELKEIIKISNPPNQKVEQDSQIFDMTFKLITYFITCVIAYHIFFSCLKTTANLFLLFFSVSENLGYLSFSFLLFFFKS